MNLRTTLQVEGQMAFPSLCLFRSPLPWIAVLVPLLIIFGFLGFGYLSILLTYLVLIISTVYFTFSKQQKPLPVKKIDKEETPKSEHSSSYTEMETVVPKLQFVNEAIAQKQEAQGGRMKKFDDCQIRLPEGLSESLPEMARVVSILQPGSESITTEKKAAAQEGAMNQIPDNLVIKSSDSLSESDQSVEDSSTSEDSETDWPFQDNVNQSSVCSDGSISDEESLIEIALPTGHYVSSNEVVPKLKLQQKMPDLMAKSKSIFQQHNSLLELLAEINDMNEEENLIEIDISMGSIKCSRFEIEA